MPGIDLHTHTSCSDGTFVPADLIALARERELDVVAITDHDTTAGISEATSAGGRLGVQVVPGVEFSAEVDGTSVHVLGYWMDVENVEFQGELRRLRDDRLLRGEQMVERLRELGYPISFERVRQIAAGGNIVRPHVAQAMVEAGIVATEEDAFTEEFIADGGRAYVPKHALHPLAALALIGRAAGLCVLAHPGMWRGEDPVPDALIEEMAAAGMSGLEVDHPDHTPEQRARYRAMAGSLLRVGARSASLWFRTDADLLARGAASCGSGRRRACAPGSLGRARLSRRRPRRPPWDR